LPWTAPRSIVTMSNIFSLLAGSRTASLFAMRCAVETSTSSPIFSLFCVSVVPVSVTSSIASTSSGGFASVAPNERCICTALLVPIRSHGVTISGSREPNLLLYDAHDLTNLAVVVRYSVDMRKVLFFFA